MVDSMSCANNEQKVAATKTRLTLATAAMFVLAASGDEIDNGRRTSPAQWQMSMPPCANVSQK